MNDPSRSAEVRAIAIQLWDDVKSDHKLKKKEDWDSFKNDMQAAIDALANSEDRIELAQDLAARGDHIASIAAMDSARKYTSNIDSLAF